MRLEVGPAEIQVQPGVPAALVAQVFNTDDVINAYEVRVFGVDPDWVDLERERLSLFPSSAGVVSVLVDVPEDYPAGPLQVGIEVTPVVDPAARQLGTVTLHVPAHRVVSMTADPQSMLTGRKGTFNLTLANDGNAPVTVELGSLDPEAKTTTAFEPPVVEIVPGEQVIVPARAKARPPLMGAPTARMLTFTARGGDSPVETLVSFVQKPTLGRGLLSLFGMLVAVSVFAIVLTSTLGRVVDVAKVDAELLKRAVEGAPAEKGIPDDPATVSGSVNQLTSGAGVGGATVELFADDDGATPVKSTVTTSDGAYVFEQLNAGKYKVHFRGVGFVDLWYPDATSFDEAKAVDVGEGDSVADVDVVIGSIPGSLAGTVVGDEPADAVVKLLVPASVLGTADDALIKEMTIGADGAFLLEEIPAPASYVLAVEKSGFTTSRRDVNLGAAENKEGIELQLRRGDGVISGVVSDVDALGIGNVAVTATNTVDEITTVTLTNGEDAGRYTLRGLPTPATYTITFAKTGYATESLTVALDAAEQLVAQDVTLAAGTGSISGTVSLAGEGPLGGVSVTISDGETTRSTSTVSVGDVGTYTLSDLPVPATYTVTFSGDGLASHVRSVDLDPARDINVVGIDARLTRATASVSGIVENADGPLANVAVELSDGTTTLTTTSADDPEGEFVLAGIPPGTYTITFRQVGAVPLSMLLTLGAGEERLLEDIVLQPQATISGTVRRAATGSTAAAPLPSAQVLAYRLAEFPTVLAASAITGADGTYTLRDLTAPDEYVIEFAYPEGALPGHSLRVVLDAGEQATGIDAVITLAGEDDS